MSETIYAWGRVGGCSLVGTSNALTPRMNVYRDRTMRYVRLSERTFAIALPLVPTSFRNYLADFPRLGEAEATSCEGVVTECEVRNALKQVGLNKSPALDGLPYEVYLRMSHMFVPILRDMFNHFWAYRACLADMPDCPRCGCGLEETASHVFYYSPS